VIGARLFGHRLDLGGQLGRQPYLDAPPSCRNLLCGGPEALHDPMHALAGHPVARGNVGRLQAVYQNGTRDLDGIEREAAEARP